LGTTRFEMTKGGRHGNNNAANDSLEDEPEVTMEIGFPTVVVADNTPIVGPERTEKLKLVLSKIFNAVGKVRDLHLPVGQDQQTMGFVFVEYHTAEEAETAIKKLNGYKLDKNHVFLVNNYEDFRKYENIGEEYAAPEPTPFSATENLRSWLLREDAADQYCLRYQDTTEIVWNTGGDEPLVDIKQDKWTETFAKWSPLGTYFLTIITTRGVVTWGGSKWEKVHRFPHAGVKVVDWSPSEKYLVTAAPQYQENDDPNDPQCIIIWDARTGVKLRGFLGSNNSTWPVFKWTSDDKYFIRMSEDTLSIYEAPSMTLIDQKSLKIPGLKDFAVSPSDPIISYFVPERDNKPASVVLIDIPSKKERRSKNLMAVGDCKMFWHPQGHFLCIKAEKINKTKKTSSTDFEIIRLREKDVPIDHLEIKDPLVAFAWEPKGNRFAILAGEGPRPNLSFYVMEKTVKLLKTIDKKTANHLFWSPEGNHIVLAGLQNLNGVLEFFSVNDMETMGTEDHFMATNVEWDPSGRYVTSYVSFWRHPSETGYNLYNFQGKVLMQVMKERFYEFLWRPRPKSLLPEKRQDYIKRNMAKFAENLEKEDKEIKAVEKARKQKIRGDKREAFEAIISKLRNRYNTEAAQRAALGVEEEKEEDIERQEEWVEEVEDYQEVPIFE